MLQETGRPSQRGKWSWSTHSEAHTTQLSGETFQNNFKRINCAQGRINTIESYRYLTGSTSLAEKITPKCLLCLAVPAFTQLFFLFVFQFSHFNLVLLSSSLVWKTKKAHSATLTCFLCSLNGHYCHWWYRGPAHHLYRIFPQRFLTQFTFNSHLSINGLTFSSNYNNED